MRIYLMRHGEAVSGADWTGGDDTRPLSEMGRGLLDGALPHMKRLGFSVSGFLVSPFSRTLQTAEILSPLFPQVPVQKTPALASGAKPSAFKDTLLHFQNQAPLLLIGHMPDLNIFAARLLDEPSLMDEAPMQPGEIMALETGDLAASWGQGKMIWRYTLQDWPDLKGLK